MNANHESWKQREAMSVADVLERAAQIMQERGKCEHALERDGRVCALGALRIAALGSVDPISKALPEHVTTPLVRFVPHGMIADWSNNNDAPTVIAGLRACAAIERAKQSPAQPVAVCAELES